MWSLACAGLVLVAVGFSVRAPVKDWWLAREACGGALPSGDLKRLRADGRLGLQRESFDEDLGEYHCVLTDDADKVVIAVDAYPPGAARDEELRFVGDYYPPHAVLPGGLPGFEDQHSRVFLMPECPDGVKDPRGEDHRLLVTTWTYFAESREEEAVMLRLAVRMTNEVTAKLGCGGEPLPEPKDGAVPDTGRFVPRAEATGTACHALLPPRASRWKDATGRCASPSRRAGSSDGAPCTRRRKRTRTAVTGGADRSSNSPCGAVTGARTYARWAPAPTRCRWATHLEARTDRAQSLGRRPV